MKVAREWTAYQQRRFARPDARRFMREDARRFFKPGFDTAFGTKAGFDPAQPRDDNGRWADTGSGDGSEDNPYQLPTIVVTPDADDTSFEDAFGEWLIDLFDGIIKEPQELQTIIVYANDTQDGTSALLVSNPGPEGEPPGIPDRRPSSRSEVNTFLKAAARWISRNIAADARVKAFIALYEAASWLDTDRYFIEAYRDAPKTLDELQAGAGQSKWGYNTHHIVEQTPAEKEGYPRSLIDGRENLVRIPALKHWEITGWYATENELYGGLSPRDYLRGKSWDEKTRVGLEAMQRFGVLAK